MHLRLLFLIAILAPILAAEEMEMMLKEYARKSDLSEKTKRENSGQLILYTRSDLDKMQARNLKDIVKQHHYFGYYENRFANIDMNPTAYMPSNSSLMRVYIDDQEVASGLISSGYSILGNIELDFVDHIEIYKAAPSYSFTVEPTLIIIRLYSKDAERDEGGALSVRYGSRGTNQENIAYAQRLETFSYFAYGAHVQEDRDSVDGNLGMDLEQDKKDIHLFATLKSEDDLLQFHYLQREQDAFAGLSRTLTPLSSESETDYLHIGYERRFTDALSLMVTYDHSEHTFDHDDLLPLTDSPTPLYDANNRFDDQVMTAKVQHRFEFDDHTLLSGIKYRNNQFDSTMYMGGIPLSKSRFDEQHITTLFLEDQYSTSDDSLLTAGIKYSYYKNNGDIADTDFISGHLSWVYPMPIGTSKFFINYDTTPTTPWVQINPLFDIGHLVDQKIFTATFSFDVHAKDHDTSWMLRHIRLKDFTYMSADSTIESFDETIKGHMADMTSKYRFDTDHELQFNINYTYLDNVMHNDHSVLNSYLRLFDSWGDIQIFNELYVRDNLKNDLDDLSFDYSAGVSYSVDERLNISLKGENIFDHSRLNTFLVGIDPLTGDVQRKSYQTIQQTFLVQVKYLF